MMSGCQVIKKSRMSKSCVKLMNVANNVDNLQNRERSGPGGKGWRIAISSATLMTFSWKVLQ